MKECSAALAALLLLWPGGAAAADSLEEAAREMARLIAAFAGAREPVGVEFQTQGTEAGEGPRAARLVEAGLRDLGARQDARAPAQVRVTFSGNATRLLLGAEARREEERKQWLVSWPRQAEPSVRRVPAAIEKRLLWEQDEPVLDAVLAGDRLLVLSPSAVALLARTGGGWVEQARAGIVPPRPLPRDPRGRLQVEGGVLRALLPGFACSGTVQPLTLACRPGDEPWPILSGGLPPLLGAFTAGRNYFEGRIAAPDGRRTAVPPFYTAAAVEEDGAPLWLFAGIDGRVTALGRTGQALPVAAPGWGSDIAGVEARCAGGQAVLATRPGDENEAVTAWAVANRRADAVSAPSAMPGPVTALWPAAGGALAVARDKNRGKYAAYLLTIVCGS